MAGKGKDIRNVTSSTIRVAKRTVTTSARARAGNERQKPPRAAHDTHVPPLEAHVYEYAGADDYDVLISTTGTAAGTSSSSAANEEWILNGPTGGGPEDHRLLRSFRGHVTYAIWNNPDEPHGPLRIQSWTSKLAQLPSYDDENMGEAWDLMESTGLLYLRDTFFRYHNAPLISAFIERWHSETNNFHLPFGEMTITLHDVYHILGLPIMGLSCTNPDLLEEDDIMCILTVLLEEEDVETIRGLIVTGAQWT